MQPLTGIQLISTAAVEILKRPKFVVMGMLPPFGVSVVYLIIAAIGGPALFAQLSRWVAGVSSAWPTWAATIITWMLMLVLVAGVILIAAVGFTTLTLAIGGPIYDRIGETIERELLGFTPIHEDHLGVAVMRSASQSAIIFALSLFVVGLNAALGLLPAIGTLASLIGGLCLGGWLVSTELLGGPFGRRGKPKLSTRWQYMRNQALTTLSFAIPAQFVLSIPVVSVFAFPFLSAAATLLAHKLITEPNPNLKPSPKHFA